MRHDAKHALVLAWLVASGVHGPGCFVEVILLCSQNKHTLSVSTVGRPFALINRHAGTCRNSSQTSTPACAFEIIQLWILVHQIGALTSSKSTLSARTRPWRRATTLTTPQEVSQTPCSPLFPKNGHVQWGTVLQSSHMHLAMTNLVRPHLSAQHLAQLRQQVTCIEYLDKESILPWQPQ